MATATKTCGVCELRHITKPPIVWCSECEEGLCTECQEHHSLSKGTRNHKVIPITEYSKLSSLSYDNSTSIQNFISDKTNFGEVHIEAKSSDIVLFTKKAKQAQMMVPTVQSRSIEDITLTKQNTMNIQGGGISGCCMLSDGRMAFTHYWAYKVIVYNMKGEKEFEVKMPGNAFDIVYISEKNTLAVTSGGSRKMCITIIDLEKKQIKKTIPLDSKSYGIALKDNLLMYSGNNKGIRMMNLDDESISDIVRDAVPSDCYTATFRDKIYHSNYKTSAVTCFNLQGEIQWTFQNESILNFPQGIDVDSDGNVYVADQGSCNIIAISSDGQHHREVLTASDGLQYPTSLKYSEQKNQLLVANYNNTAHLFNVI